MEIPMWVYLSIMATVVAGILLEIFRPEIFGMKKRFRAAIKADTNNGVNPEL